MKSKIFGLIIFIIILSTMMGINNYMIGPTKKSNSSLENFSQNNISLSFQNTAINKIGQENPNQITLKLSNMPEELKQGKKISDSKWQFSVEPGAPQIPVRPYKILLPPCIKPDSVNIEIIDYKYVKSNTLYEYPLAPLAAISTRDGIITSVSEDVLKHNIINQFWPSKIIDDFYIQQMRDAVIVCFNYYPCSYNSETKELIEYKDVTISITWEESNIKELDPLTKSFLLNSRDDIDNLDDYLILYEPNEVPDSTYLIVTTNAIQSNSQKLDDFIRYKQASGFIVEVITEDEYGPDTGKQRVLNIRDWLINNYVSKSIEYVLLIGDPDPDEEGVSDTYGDLPMLMCWPRRAAATYQESPTDYFYADLTGNWDFDGDGYYGEHIIGNGTGEDHVAGGVDYAAEVYVGRIPVYDSEYSTLDTVLQGIIDHHINAGAEKSKILLPMAISNYANEDWSGWDRTDGLDCPEEVYNNIASPKGMEDTVMYETSGLSPVPTTAFHYNISLNEANIISQMNAGHGALFWWGHGLETGVYRKYWAYDQGNDVPESAEMNWITFLTSSQMNQLETDQPTFSYQSSCENGYPEDSNNLQYALLKRGAAVSTVSASRVSWYIIGTWNSTAWWSQYADNTGIGYYYMYNLLRSEMTSGIALYSAKFSGGASASYDGSCMNKMDFNLYGDPHLNYWGSNQPNAPTNPSPSNGATEVSTNPTLSVDVSDPDGGLLDVAFYNATDNSLIDIDLQVSSGGTASVIWSGLAEDIIYRWYVIVGDGQVIRQSATWSFYTGSNTAPDAPSNPIPVDGATGVSLNPTLSVNVSDPDGHTMDVSFYNASDDSLIGTDTGVSSGGTASTTWFGLSQSVTYQWYAIANDSLASNQSATWSFTTINSAPDAPTDPIPVDGATGVSRDPTLSVNVYDPDGDTMDVSFYDASDDSLIGTDTGVSSGGNASIIWLGLSGNTYYEWYAIANDSLASTQSATWSFTTINSAPDAPTDPIPVDGAIDVSVSPMLNVDVFDPDGDSMDVFFYNASNDSLIGTDTGVSSGGTASITWFGLSGNTYYEWYTIANDSVYATQSATWSFTTINTAPYAPTNPVPADGSIDVSINPILSIDVFDPDGDSMDVSFYDASDDSLIGTDMGVLSGGIAYVTWFGLSRNTYYEWYAIANDSSYTNQSDTWSFTTISTAPYAPTNPIPADGAIDVSVSPMLSVDVFDLDGDSMDVSFYNAFDDSLIGTDTGVSSGGTASINWSGLSEGVTYQWYAIAYDGSTFNQSATWLFTVLEDTPIWEDLPTDQIIEYGDDFSYDLDAFDSSGIYDWWINDTNNFAIDSDGLVTNIVSLSVGIYWLEVRAYDTYGRYCNAIFKVTVEGEPEGDGGIPGYDFLITLVMIAIISLILIRGINQKKNKRFSY